MICPRCGFNNGSNAKFCGKCALGLNVADNEYLSHVESSASGRNQMAGGEFQNPALNNQMPVQNNQMPVQNNQMPVQNNQMPVQNNQMPVQNNQMPVPENRPMKKGMSGGTIALIIGLSVLLLGILGAIAYLLFTQMNGAKDEPGNPDREEWAADEATEIGEEDEPVAAEEEKSDEAAADDFQEDPFTVYVQDEINPNMIALNGEYPLSAWSTYDNGAPDYENLPSGYMSYNVYDIDRDGDDELIAVRFDSSACLTTEIYEKEGSRVYMAANARFGERVGALDLCCYDCYIYDTDKLMFEKRRECTYFYDGVTVGYASYRYDGKTLIKEFDEEFAGSDYDDDYFEKRLRQHDIDIDFQKVAPGEKMISDYVNNAKPLARVYTVWSGLDYEQVESWMSSSNYALQTVNVRFDDTFSGAPDFEFYYGYENGSSSDSDFIIPDSDSRYISESELYGFSKDECRIARNEIYARHGRMFDSEDLKEHFGKFDWYNPTISPDEFSANENSILNDYEQKNRDTIHMYEKKQGYIK